MPETITINQLNAIKNQNKFIIDIRTPLEFSSYHLPGAVNIPYDLLMTYPDSYLKQGVTYYLICAHGSVSFRAAAILESYGYNIISIQDGYTATEFRCYCW